jgi:hypothetical protein
VPSAPAGARARTLARARRADGRRGPRGGCARPPRLLRPRPSPALRPRQVTDPEQIKAGRIQATIATYMAAGMRQGPPTAKADARGAATGHLPDGKKVPRVEALVQGSGF